MTAPSLYQATGLSAAAYKPTIDPVAGSYEPAGQLLDDTLMKHASAYEHEILAMGGWWTASMTMSLPLVQAEDWYAEGLGRHIEVYNPALDRIWQGFVNLVTLTAGTLTATQGPLMDIANRLSVTYTPILDPTTTPPILGTQTTTTIANNAASQTRYGIVEQVLSQGQLLDDGTTDEATKLRDTALPEMAWPEASQDLAIGESAEVTVALELLGYAHWFNTYVVQDLTAATIQLDTKLQNTIAADPNGIFVTDYSQMAANPYLVSRYEDDNRTAWTIIQQLVSVGDAANNRYTFGIYDGFRAHYAAVPDTPAYQHELADKAQRVEVYADGAKVEPWDVLPARWLFVPDFLVGRSQSAQMRLDPRYQFIESVRYTAPYQLHLRGNKVGKLSQMLAQKGMWG